MNVNLKLLHSFLLVADHGSFRRAAEEANRSQSAVSMQVRQLELQLGVALFHRTTRKVELTREGEMLLDCARKAAIELQIGLRRIKEAAGRAPEPAPQAVPEPVGVRHVSSPRRKARAQLAVVAALG
jgi:DNA-binding transcriptional LysR family regulator